MSSQRESHFVVNLQTREFHINPLGRETALAQHAKGDCHAVEIKDRTYEDDFASLIVQDFNPCAHCVGRLSEMKHR